MRLSNVTKTELLPKMANRHGFIAGATGTGKTVSLKLLAEQFSEMGVPVFLSDVKGDLSGMASGECPVEFWDVYSQTGIPFHSKICAYPPILLSKLLTLSETQTSILSILLNLEGVEKIVDLNLLKKVLINLVNLTDVDERIVEHFGYLSKISITTLVRKIQAFQSMGGDQFFSGIQLDIQDLFKVKNGKGVINILDATRLMNNPNLYTTSLLWLLNEMYTTLSEVGDMEKPKMVFFFDEAHLLFNDCPKVLLKTIERIIKLVRSKGVGVYFITQSPKDIPESVLAQLGNRIQHALRAYTPKEFQAVKIAAKTFRASSDFDTEEEIMQLKIGEALISMLDEHGAPTVVEKVKINRPSNMLGVFPTEKRMEMVKGSELLSKYTEVEAEVIVPQRHPSCMTMKQFGDAWRVFGTALTGILAVIALIANAFVFAFGGKSGRRR